MVVEGEQVQASLTTNGKSVGRIEAHKADDTPVLTGTASVGPDHPQTELEARLASQGDPGELFIVDQLRWECGATSRSRRRSTTLTQTASGIPSPWPRSWPRITEPHPWYTPEGGAGSPWGRAILPMEMISVLSNKVGPPWPVRGPALGLFLDLEIRLVEGPVFVDQTYTLEKEIAGLSQSRRTESYWTRTTITDADSGRVAAVVLLHSGVFKESYADYPKARLGRWRGVARGRRPTRPSRPTPPHLLARPAWRSVCVALLSV